jgi:hypothetical protein
MEVRLSRIWLYSACATLGLLALLWAMSAALAQAPPGEASPQTDISAAATVASRISYQGEVREGGVPVTGKRTMTVRLYSNSSCTSLLQTIALGSVPVTNGRFSVAVNVNQALFNGQGIWLRLQVGTALMACQEFMPVPYALSLRPGAIIKGAASGSGLGNAVLNIRQLGQAGGINIRTDGSSAVYATSGGTAVYGRSSGYEGVWGSSSSSTGGHFTSQGGHGLVATTASTDTTDSAGFFTAKGGYGVYARSAHNNAIRGVGGTDLSGVALPAGPVGVAGLSATHAGVYGATRGAAGVQGKSTQGAGVRGESETYLGVEAVSVTGHGLHAYSRTSTAIVAGSRSGHLIELFDWSPQLDRRFYVTNGGDVWSDTRFTARGADLAVRVQVGESVEAGDVLEIDPEHPGYFRRSRQARSTLVVGVVSSAPGFVVNELEYHDPHALLVQAGLVAVKVCDEGDAIAPGDLLVASSTPGLAMRGGSNPPEGAVIGTALGKLTEGQGVISMLVMP